MNNPENESLPLIRAGETYKQFQARAFAEELGTNDDEKAEIKILALEILGESPSFARKILPFSISFATNAGIYLLLESFFPEFVFAGAIASTAGALTALLSHHQFNLRNGVKKIKAGIPFLLDGIPLSEGVRPVGELLVSKLNPTAGIITAAILPPIAQNMMFFNNSAGARARSREAQLEELHQLRRHTIENRV